VSPPPQRTAVSLPNTIAFDRLSGIFFILGKVEVMKPLIANAEF
jgi:hypothetical protein